MDDRLTEGSYLLELVAVMDRLRSPGGCPWDAEQTHRSLIEYLVEEAYETVEAIEQDDRVALREELGDLLLQVVFHARLAQEDPDDPWSIEDVAAGIVSKLITRHPHVFGDAEGSDPETVEANWQAIKATEKGRESVTDGIPAHLPALAKASKVLYRAEKAKIRIVATESDQQAASTAMEFARTADEAAYGDALLAAVAMGRARGYDPETALREAVARMTTRIREAEAGVS